MPATLTAGVKSIILNLDTPYDSIRTTDVRDDLIGIKVWYSTTSGFTPPGQGTLAFDGISTSITIPDLVVGTTYYVKYAFISAIDPATYTVSSELSAIPVEGPSTSAYWLVTSTPTIQKSVTNILTPSSITSTIKTSNATTGPQDYSGRFIIATSTDGSTYTTQYTSSANESSYTYTPNSSVKTIRVRAYLAGGTTTLLDEEIITVVSDGATGNDGTAYWLVTNTPTIQKTVTNTLTPSSITATIKQVIGGTGPQDYSGRFIIATSTDGSTYTNQYTSSANESTYTYTPSSSVKTIRVRAYLAGGTTTLLDEEIITVVSDGATGTRTAVLEMYQWAISAPTTFPSGTSTYTWSTGTFTAPAAANNWTIVPGTGSAGQTLWATKVVYVDSLTDATASVTWPASNTAYAVGTNGSSGTSILMIFKRSFNQPATPSPSTTTPSTWYADASSVPAGTDAMWASVGSKPSNSDTITWQVPFRIEGKDGIKGDSSRVAYLTQSQANSAPSVSPNPTTGDTSFPTNWSGTVTQPTAGQSLWAIDGTYSVTANTTTWGSPYLTQGFPTTIQSDNYSANSAGWQIQRNTGNAFFNNVTARGSIVTGTQGSQRIELNKDSSNRLNAFTSTNVRFLTIGGSGGVTPDSSVIGVSANSNIYNPVWIESSSPIGSGLLSNTLSTANAISAISTGSGRLFYGSITGTSNPDAAIRIDLDSPTPVHTNNGIQMNMGNSTGAAFLAGGSGNGYAFDAVTATSGAAGSKSGIGFFRGIDFPTTSSAITVSGTNAQIVVNFSNLTTAGLLACNITLESTNYTFSLEYNADTFNTLSIFVAALSAGINNQWQVTSTGTLSSGSFIFRKPVVGPVSGTNTATIGSFTGTFTNGTNNQYSSTPTIVRLNPFPNDITQVLRGDGSWGTVASSGGGTVTSVTGTGAGLGFALGGSITSSGSITLTVPTSSALKTTLGATTVGNNLFTLTNPSAISFLRVNADNTVSSLNSTDFRTAIGSTTVGSNLFTLTNPSAISFLRVNADNTVSSLNSTDFRTAIGSTTVGSNLFTLTNPSAISFLRVNADNTVSSLNSTDFRTAIGAGTVNSVGLTVPTGFTVSSSPVTGTGTLAVAFSATATQDKALYGDGSWKFTDKRYNVQNYGATGNGTTDDTIAIQTAINTAAATGGTIYFPRGTYRITSSLTYSAISGPDPAARLSFMGEGINASIIYQTGTGNGLTISGYVSAEPTNPNMYVHISDLTFAGSGSATSHGLSITGGAYLYAENCYFLSWGFGVYGSNFLSSTFSSCYFRFNQRGFRFERFTGQNIIYTSSPNAITLIGCIIGANSVYGGDVVGPGVFNMHGGSVEGNGPSNSNGSINNWGLRISEPSGNTAIESAVGANLSGVYFEINYGIADLWITSQQTKAGVSNNIDGCSFVRAGASFVTNNILLDANSSANGFVTNISGCGFKGIGYTPSASRMTIVNNNCKLSVVGCSFSSTTDAYVPDNSNLFENGIRTSSLLDLTGTSYAGTTNPLASGTASAGTSTRFSRADHVHPLSVTTATASGSGALGYNSSTGVLTYTPPVLPAGTVTSVGGTGSGLGFTLAGTVNSSGNITLTVPDAATLRTNLGLGSLATASSLTTMSQFNNTAWENTVNISSGAYFAWAFNGARGWASLNGVKQYVFEDNGTWNKVVWTPGNTTLAVTGNITATGTITPGSDARLKTNIKPLIDPFKAVRDIQGVEYTLKSDNKNSIGFIAQEVMQHYPSLVIADSKGMLSLNYNGLIAILWEQNKLLINKINSIEAKLNQ